MSVDCRQFEALWNAVLDAREAAESAALEQALAAHEASCARCRAVAARYRVLRRALGHWPPVPGPPADLVGRVLASHAAGPRRRLRDRIPRPVRWAAAVVLAATGLALRTWQPTTTRPAIVKHAPAAPAAAPRPLAAALAEATAATLDLARATSAPAARIGRQVLASAVQEAEPPPLPQPWPDTPDPDVWKSVGAGLARDVEPLSGPARRAFGFLLGPASAPPSDRGA